MTELPNVVRRKSPGRRPAEEALGRGHGPALRANRPKRVLDLLRQVSEVLETVVDPELAAWLVLVGFTAGEGLGFNRAFLLLAEGEMLRGSFGVGPRDTEEARELWAEMRRRHVLPLEGLARPDQAAVKAERERHGALLARLSHGLLPNCGSWRRAFIARGHHPNPCVRHWLGVLESRELVVVPLMAGAGPWGVVLADNFVTHAPVYHATLEAAETLAHYLRAALERTQLLQRFHEEKRRRMAAEHATALLDTARTLAHDLKNPLALAGGLAKEILEARGADREALSRQLTIVARAIARAESRVGELVEGLATRADGVSLEAVDIGTLAERITEAFRPLATSRSVRLRCYHPARQVLAAAVAPSLERCLENLIANALQTLADSGGEVQVAVRDEPPWALLEVSDNGRPLPVSLRGDPFAGGTSTHIGGTGIGLASVRTLVESMGGKVEYDEREPGWVRFTLFLRRWS